MDYHNLKRSQLQALCKKHNLHANASNLEMADALSAFFDKAQEKLVSQTKRPSCLRNSGGEIPKLRDTDPSDLKMGKRAPKKVRFFLNDESRAESQEIGVNSRKEGKIATVEGKREIPITRTRSREQKLQTGEAERYPRVERRKTRSVIALEFDWGEGGGGNGEMAKKSNRAGKRKTRSVSELEVDQGRTGGGDAGMGKKRIRVEKRKTRSMSEMEIDEGEIGNGDVGKGKKMSKVEMRKTRSKSEFELAVDEGKGTNGDGGMGKKAMKLEKRKTRSMLELDIDQGKSENGDGEKGKEPMKLEKRNTGITLESEIEEVKSTIGDGAMGKKPNEVEKRRTRRSEAEFEVDGVEGGDGDGEMGKKLMKAERKRTRRSMAELKFDGVKGKDGDGEMGKKLVKAERRKTRSKSESETGKGKSTVGDGEMEKEQSKVEKRKTRSMSEFEINIGKVTISNVEMEKKQKVEKRKTRSTSELEIDEGKSTIGNGEMEKKQSKVRTTKGEGETSKKDGEIGNEVERRRSSRNFSKLEALFSADEDLQKDQVTGNTAEDDEAVESQVLVRTTRSQSRKSILFDATHHPVVEKRKTRSTSELEIDEGLSRTGDDGGKEQIKVRTRSEFSQTSKNGEIEEHLKNPSQVGNEVEADDMHSKQMKATRRSSRNFSKEASISADEEMQKDPVVKSTAEVDDVVQEKQVLVRTTRLQSRKSLLVDATHLPVVGKKTRQDFKTERDKAEHVNDDLEKKKNKSRSKAKKEVGKSIKDGEGRVSDENELNEKNCDHGKARRRSLRNLPKIEVTVTEDEHMHKDDEVEVSFRTATKAKGCFEEAKNKERREAVEEVQMMGRTTRSRKSLLGYVSQVPLVDKRRTGKGSELHADAVKSINGKGEGKKSTRKSKSTTEVGASLKKDGEIEGQVKNPQQEKVTRQSRCSVINLAVSTPLHTGKQKKGAVESNKNLFMSRNKKIVVETISDAEIGTEVDDKTEVLKDAISENELESVSLRRSKRRASSTNDVRIPNSRSNGSRKRRGNSAFDGAIKVPKRSKTLIRKNSSGNKHSKAAEEQALQNAPSTSDKTVELFKVELEKAQNKVKEMRKLLTRRSLSQVNSDKCLEVAQIQKSELVGVNEASKTVLDDETDAERVVGDSSGLENVNDAVNVVQLECQENSAETHELSCGNVNDEESEERGMVLADDKLTAEVVELRTGKAEDLLELNCQSVDVIDVKESTEAVPKCMSHGETFGKEEARTILLSNCNEDLEVGQFQESELEVVTEASITVPDAEIHKPQSIIDENLKVAQVQEGGLKVVSEASEIVSHVNKVDDAAEVVGNSSASYQKKVGGEFAHLRDIVNVVQLRCKENPAETHSCSCANVSDEGQATNETIEWLDDCFTDKKPFSDHSTCFKDESSAVCRQDLVDKLVDEYHGNSDNKDQLVLTESNTGFETVVLGECRVISKDGLENDIEGACTDNDTHRVVMESLKGEDISELPSQKLEEFGVEHGSNLSKQHDRESEESGDELNNTDTDAFEEFQVTSGTFTGGADEGCKLEVDANRDKTEIAASEVVQGAGETITEDADSSDEDGDRNAKNVEISAGDVNEKGNAEELLDEYHTEAVGNTVVNPTVLDLVEECEKVEPSVSGPNVFLGDTLESKFQQDDSVDLCTKGTSQCFSGYDMSKEETGFTEVPIESADCEIIHEENKSASRSSDENKHEGTGEEQSTMGESYRGSDLKQTDPPEFGPVEYEYLSIRYECAQVVSKENDTKHVEGNDAYVSEIHGMVLLDIQEENEEAEENIQKDCKVGGELKDDIEVLEERNTRTQGVVGGEDVNKKKSSKMLMHKDGDEKRRTSSSVNQISGSLPIGETTKMFDFGGPVGTPKPQGVDDRGHFSGTTEKVRSKVISFSENVVKEDLVKKVCEAAETEVEHESFLSCLASKTGSEKAESSESCATKSMLREDVRASDATEVTGYEHKEKAAVMTEFDEEKLECEGLDAIVKIDGPDDGFMSCQEGPGTETEKVGSSEACAMKCTLWQDVIEASGATAVTKNKQEEKEVKMTQIAEGKSESEGLDTVLNMEGHGDCVTSYVESKNRIQNNIQEEECMATINETSKEVAFEAMMSTLHDKDDETSVQEYEDFDDGDSAHSKKESINCDEYKEVARLKLQEPLEVKGANENTTMFESGSSRVARNIHGKECIENLDKTSKEGGSEAMISTVHNEDHEISIKGIDEYDEGENAWSKKENYYGEVEGANEKTTDICESAAGTNQDKDDGATYGTEKNCENFGKPQTENSLCGTVKTFEPMKNEEPSNIQGEEVTDGGTLEVIWSMETEPFLLQETRKVSNFEADLSVLEKRPEVMANIEIEKVKELGDSVLEVLGSSNNDELNGKAEEKDNVKGELYNDRCREGYEKQNADSEAMNFDSKDSEAALVNAIDSLDVQGMKEMNAFSGAIGTCLQSPSGGIENQDGWGT